MGGRSLKFWMFLGTTWYEMKTFWSCDFFSVEGANGFRIVQEIISPARRTDRTCLFSAWNRVNWCDKVASCLAAPHPYRWGSPINGQVFPSPFPRPVEVLSFDALCGFAAATRSWRMWVEPDGLSRQPNRRLRTLVDVQDVDAMDLWL